MCYKFRWDLRVLWLREREIVCFLYKGAHTVPTKRAHPWNPIVDAQTKEQQGNCLWMEEGARLFKRPFPQGIGSLQLALQAWRNTPALITLMWETAIRTVEFWSSQGLGEPSKSLLAWALQAPVRSHLVVTLGYVVLTESSAWESSSSTANSSTQSESTSMARSSPSTERWLGPWPLLWLSALVTSAK